MYGRQKCFHLGHNPSSFRLTCNQTFRSFLSVFTYRSIGLLSTIVRSPNPITLYAEQWSSSGSTSPQVRCYELVYQLCKVICGEHPRTLSAVHRTPFTTAANTSRRISQYRYSLVYFPFLSTILGFVAPIWLLGQPTFTPPKAFGFSPSNLALPNKIKSDFEVRWELLWSLVPALGLEPRRMRPTGLKPDASTNSAIPAYK